MGVLAPLPEVTFPPAGIQSIDRARVEALAPGGGLMDAGCADKGVATVIVAIAIAAINKRFMASPPELATKPGTRKG
jgi:hypothetical protein